MAGTAMKQYGQSGWYGESYRHYLAAKGVPTYHSARQYNGLISSGARLLAKGKSYLPVIKIVDKAPVLAKDAALLDKFGFTVAKVPVVNRAAESVVRAKSLVGTEAGAASSVEKLRALSSQAKLGLGNDILKLDVPSSVLRGGSLAEKQIATEAELLRIGRTSSVAKNSIADIGGRVLTPELYSVKGLVAHPLDYKSLARIGTISKSGITAREIELVSREATIANRALNSADFARIAAAHVDEVTGKLGMARGAIAGERGALIARLADDYERAFTAGGRGFWKGLSPVKKVGIVGGGLVTGGSIAIGRGIPLVPESVDPLDYDNWKWDPAPNPPGPNPPGPTPPGPIIPYGTTQDGRTIYYKDTGKPGYDGEPLFYGDEIGASGKSGFPWGAIGAAGVGVGALGLALAMSKSGNEEERQRRQQAEMESQLLNQQVRAYREEAMKQIRKNELQRELATLE